MIKLDSYNKEGPLPIEYKIKTYFDPMIEGSYLHDKDMADCIARKEASEGLVNKILRKDYFTSLNNRIEWVLMNYGDCNIGVNQYKNGHSTRVSFALELGRKVEKHTMCKFEWYCDVVKAITEYPIEFVRHLECTWISVPFSDWAYTFVQQHNGKFDWCECNVSKKDICYYGKEIDALGKYARWLHGPMRTYNYMEYMRIISNFLRQRDPRRLYMLSTTQPINLTNQVLEIHRLYVTDECEKYPEGLVSSSNEVAIWQCFYNLLGRDMTIPDEVFEKSKVQQIINKYEKKRQDNYYRGSSYQGHDPYNMSVTKPEFYDIVEFIRENHPNLEWVFAMWLRSGRERKQ